jgi:hypothetical protein
VSEAELPDVLASGHEVTVGDVRRIIGASTPHFSLQVRNRLERLVAGLEPGDPARQEAEQAIARLDKLAYDGETRGPIEEYDQPLPSLQMEDD